MPNEPTWTEDKIRSAFEKFSLENNRFPTCDDMDACSYLPTVRTLQRRFGGAKGWRTKLGLEIVDYRVGSTRSATASMIGKRGRAFEQEIAVELIEYFGEMYVHEQKPFNNYQGRLDFYIYGETKRFGIDVFYPDTYRNLVKCINIKEKTYKNVDCDLILLSVNPSITQDNIDQYISKRKTVINNRINILSRSAFFNYVKTVKPYR